MKKISILLCPFIILACSSSPRSPEGTNNSKFVLIKNTYKEGEITNLCAGAISSAKESLNRIVQSNGRDISGSSSLLNYEKVMADFSDSVTPLTFMAYVSKDENASNEASQCEIDVGKFAVEVLTRRDLYNAIKKSKSKSSQESRLLKETLEDFEKNGLKLSDQKLNKIQNLKKRLTTLESQFSTNLNKDDSFVLVSNRDLEGVPENYIKSLKKNDNGELILPMTESDYPIVMQNCKNAETRKKVFLAFFNRGGQKNLDLLTEAVSIRADIAKTMGFKNWADLKVQKRMAKNSKTIFSFLNGLKNKLSARNAKDFQRLLEFKKEFEPAATSLNQWDTPYYNYQLKKKKYSLDNEKIREYFPAETVIQGMFAIYSEMLGVKFEVIPNAEVWDESVKLYAIKDSQSGQLIGYFFTDFYPRKGKYDHAAAFSLISGRKLDSQYSLPVSSIVANLTPGMNGRPPLLDHADVVTIFHEFGHIMHQTLTKAPYASLSGSSVAHDFVEAPSQMLENWVWSENILNKISGYYADPRQKLPKEILTKMLEARDFNQSIFYTRQLLYSLFDMTLHTQKDKIDPNQLYMKLYKEILGQEPAAEQKFPASFGHIMGGYDAGYYGYLWSEVYAQDMFTQFPQENLGDPQVGLRYRKIILESGNMEEADSLLKKFLGRKPNDNAFFKKLGI